MAWWIGWLLWLLKDYTQLFTFDNSLITGFLLACLSSGTTYLLCMVVGDEGIKHEFKKVVIITA